MNEYVVDNLVRVNSEIAKRMYNSGINVTLVLPQYRPNLIQSCASCVNIESSGESFDSYVNSYEHYNQKKPWYWVDIDAKNLYMESAKKYKSIKPIEKVKKHITDNMKSTASVAMYDVAFDINTLYNEIIANRMFNMNCADNNTDNSASIKYEFERVVRILSLKGMTQYNNMQRAMQLYKIMQVAGFRI